MTAVLGVPLALNGADYRLRFDWWAWAALEDAGYPRSDVITHLGDGSATPTKFLLCLIWAGLQHEQEPPTLKQVGGWITGENQNAVLTALGEALRASFPAAKEEAAPSADPFVSGRGTASGAPRRSLASRSTASTG